jgi:hypothetical protein
MKKLITRLSYLAITSILFITPASAQVNRVWEFSDNQSNKPAWIDGNQRGLAVVEQSGFKYVLVASATTPFATNPYWNIRILNANDGSEVGLLDITGYDGTKGTFRISDVFVSDDNKILVSNYAEVAGHTAFLVQKFNGIDDTSPTVVLSDTRIAATGWRIGRVASVTGSFDAGTATIYAISTPASTDSPQENKIVRYTQTGPGANFDAAGADVFEVASVGTNPQASADKTGSSPFYWTADGLSVAKMSATGTQIGTIPTGVLPTGTLRVQFIGTFDGDDYIAVINRSNTRADLVRVPGGVPASAVLVGSTPSLGTALGFAVLGDMYFDKTSSGFDAYVMGSGRGIGKYTVDISNTKEITGDAGWRMLSLPVGDVTIASLAESNLVQGISGGTYSAFESNLFTSINTSGAFVAATSISSTIPSGNGFIWYLYNNTSQAESKALPFTLTVKGLGPEGDITRVVNSDKWNLLGNPFKTAISVADITANGEFYSAVQVWQDGSGEGTGGAAASTTGSFILSSSEALEGKIAPWQGFILASIDATEITIPQSAKTTGGTFLRDNPTPQIEFALSSVDGERTVILDRASILHFNESATTGWDRHDLAKLGSFEAESGLLYFVGTRNGDLVAKSQESRPIDFDTAIEIPLDVVAYGIDGDFQISWPVMRAIPEDVQVLLIDNYTGAQVSLKEGLYYEFAMNVSLAKSSRSFAPGQELSITAAEPRFVLRISRESSTSIETATELPDGIALEQNYPNPFNPTTRISYTMPVSGTAHLAVYDLLGREVAVLVNGPVAAGSQFVNFDASALSSGVYMYRLTAGGQTLTRKMTLMK